MEALRKHHAEEIEHHKKEIERLQREIERHQGKIRKLKHDDWSCWARYQFSRPGSLSPVYLPSQWLSDILIDLLLVKASHAWDVMILMLKKIKHFLFEQTCCLLWTSLVCWVVQRTIGCLLLVLFTAVVMLLYSPTYLVTLPKQHIQKGNQRLNAAFRLCPFRVTSYLIICKAYELLLFKLKTCFARDNCSSFKNNMWPFTYSILNRKTTYFINSRAQKY